MYIITAIFNDGDARVACKDDAFEAIEFVGYCIKSLDTVTGVFIEKEIRNDSAIQ